MKTVNERRASNKAREFEVATANVHQIVDALFDPDCDEPGDVTMFANEKGRGHIQNLFPQAKIVWHPAEAPFPDDWKRVGINLPMLVNSRIAKLDLGYIPAGKTIDDASPTQFGLLLAFGVNHDGGWHKGGRAAVMDYMGKKPTILVFTAAPN